MPRWPVRTTKRHWAVLVGVAIVVAAVVLPHGAWAQEANPGNSGLFFDIQQKLYAFLSNIVMAILQTVALLTQLLIQILVFVSQYNHFIDVAVVKTGWALVRDITNMFFIIALLIIAAGTVLRLENYRYNRLLSKVILMAFLVNFSRLIAGFFIQTSQVIMLTFVNAYKDAMFGNFAQMFGLDTILQFSSNPRGLINGVTDFNIILLSLIAGLMLMVVAMIVTLTMVVILIVRIIALWILVILSPLAYAARILPNTASYSTRWWSQFGKYVTVGPVLAFFLWLALAVVAGSGQSTTNSTATSDIGREAEKFENEQRSRPGGDDVVAPFANEALRLNKLVSFMVATIFLVMGMQYASGSGVAGAKIAGSLASGAVLGATGVSWLRNRTVAPVQGWLATRRTRQKEQIAGRAERLTSISDRAKALTSTSIAGRQAARADVRRFDQRRTAADAKRRGYDVMSDEELRRDLARSNASVIQPLEARQQAGLLQEMNKRGIANLQDTNVRRAFDRITSSSRIGARLPQVDREKLGEDIYRSNAVGWNEATARTFLPGAQTPKQQAIIVNRLNEIGAIRAENAGDQTLVQNLRNGLQGIPGELKSFDDALKKNNPRMAIEAIYNGFRQGQQNVDQMLQDVQSGSFDLRHVSRNDTADMLRGMRNGSGMSLAEGRDYVATRLLQDSRTQQKYTANMEAMNPDVRRALHSGADIRTTGPNPNLTGDARMVREKQDWLALQGYAGESYRHEGNRDTLMRRYVQENTIRVADLARTGRLSRETLGATPGASSAAMSQMMDERRIGRKVLSEMVDNNPELRTAARDSAHALVTAMNATATATADMTTEEGRRQNNRREILMDVGQGGNVRNAATGNDESVVDVAYAGVAGSREARQSGLRKVGESFTRMDLDPTTMSELARRDVTMHMTPAALFKVAEKNPQIARDVADLKRAAQGYAVGHVLETEAITGPEHAILTRQMQSLRRNDRGI